MLKSLELFGFKSFAERTVFDLSSGMTGIVGPNGSGKSNVVDGIKWILGDQSAKSLRGKEMTDVIFNGATDRKPSGFAEASLTFDNAGGFLPIESQEVQIGRRLYRNGDSEYLINRESCRLKDVRNLLMGTGAGSAAYSIIEQGQVDQILQANATSRRAIFEEAAGISRYRARRGEALRKLERVNQNLLRLTDIVDEVEVQVNSLRSQAAKAAKYREISNDLKERWLGLAADDFRHLAGRLAEVEATIEESTAEIESLSAQQQQLEERIAEFDEAIAEADARHRGIEREGATNREAIARLQSTVAHQETRLRELAVEITRLRGQRALMRARARDVDGELAHNRRVFEESQRDFARVADAIESRDRRIREQAERIAAERKAVERMQAALAERVDELAQMTTESTSLQSRLEGGAASETEGRKRFEKLEEQLACCREECRRQQALYDETLETATVLEEQIRAARRQREALIGERGEFQESLVQLREQKSALAARKGVLEDLESREEGLGLGVREILKRARTAAAAPWNGVLGTVADLLEVDLEEAALLEVALGERSQMIVMREAGALLEYLQAGSSQICGRVRFLPLEAEQEANRGDAESGGSPAPDLSGRPGVLKRADELVRSPEEYPLLARRLLGETWVVETLETARNLSEEAGEGLRFVTLQGELLERDGTLVAGTLRSESMLVSRKSELRQLQEELEQVGQRIRAEEGRLEDVGESIHDAETAACSVDADLQELARRQAELKSDLATAEKEYRRLSDDRERLIEELEQLAGDQTRIRRDLETHRQAQQHAEMLRQEQAEKIDHRKREIEHLEQQLQEFKQERSEEQLELAKQEERLGSLKNAVARLERDQQQRLQQHEEVERRFASAVSKRRQVSLETLNTRAELAELFLLGEQFTERAAVVSAELKELKSQRNRVVEEANEFRRQRRDVQENLHRLEIQQSDFHHRMKALETRIEEEYHIALADVVRSGTSAVAQYLEERSGSVSGGAAEAETQVEARGRETEREIGFEEIREELESQVNRLRKKLKMMGSVNTDSLQSLDELEGRYRHLSTQLQDLVEAKRILEEIVGRIDAESRRLFQEAFDLIRANFQVLFRKAFSGGNGDIVLEDASDMLECGIDIVARPPGKELKSISLMSGGEKSLTAFALLLAIFRFRPSPYCVLDEVDAALDEANVERYLSLLEDFRESTQFVLITHKKQTMTIADVLYGVTMEESGVSKKVSVRFEDVREDGRFATPPAGDSAREAA